MRRCGLAILVFISFAEQVSAQSFYAVRRERSIIAVAGTGTSTYFGELANDGHYVDAKPSLNLGLQYFFGNHISGRAEATWFTLGGSDAASGEPGRMARNLSFHSNNFELNATGAFSFFSNGNRHYRRPSFNIYGFTGIGLMYYNPKATYQGQKYALRPLQTEGVSYSSLGVVIPYGLGARIKINPDFNLAIEGGYRKTFTDYLDDVSNVFIDNNSFTDPIAKALADRRPELNPPKQTLPAGHQRGNPKNLDGYMLLNLKLEYYLPLEVSRSNNSKFVKKKRNAMYRYNRKGGFKQRRR